MKAFKHLHGNDHYLVKRKGKPTLHILVDGKHVHINTVDWDPEEEGAPRVRPCTLHEALTMLKIAYELLEVHPLLNGEDYERQ